MHTDGFRGALRALACSLVLVGAAGACDGSADETTESASAGQGAVVDPPFRVARDLQGLTLAYIDGDGLHTAMSLGEVPEAHRAQVRVDSLELSPEERDPGAVYVADLRAPREDGSYEVRRLERDAFDALVDEATGAAARAAAREAEAEAEAQGQQALADADVVIYGASWCHACRSAGEYLQQRGVPFVEKDIEREPGAREEMTAKAQAAGVRPGGIPIIDFRGHILTGFDQRAIDRLIEQTSGTTI